MVIWRAGSIDSRRIATTSSEECDAKPRMRFDEGAFLFLVSGSFFPRCRDAFATLSHATLFLETGAMRHCDGTSLLESHRIVWFSVSEKSASCKALPGEDGETGLNELPRK